MLVHNLMGIDHTHTKICGWLVVPRCSKPEPKYFFVRKSVQKNETTDQQSVDIINQQKKNNLYQFMFPFAPEHSHQAVDLLRISQVEGLRP